MVADKVKSLSRPQAGGHIDQTSSSQLSYTGQVVQYNPFRNAFQQTDETTAYQISHLFYTVKGFKHRKTTPFDQIVLQRFQACTWRARAAVNNVMVGSPAIGK